HNALVGTGLRHLVKIGAAGKITSGSDIVKRLIQGADFTMSARAMMMATGCIQAQKCHTNHCPVGVATQDPRLVRALDVEDKSHRVHNYHKLTVREAVQIMASMGVTNPSQLNTRMLRRRVDHLTTRSYASIYHWLREDELLTEPPRGWAADWAEADPDHFGEHAPLPDAGPYWRELPVEPSELAPRRAPAAEAPSAEESADEGGGHGAAEGTPQPRSGGLAPVRDATPATEGTQQDRGTRRTPAGSTPVVSDAPRPEGRPGT
ncbi:MAG TPA: glutamate synthase-related protein, partial [Citricoccus sp.]